MKAYIYKIENKANGKFYIGSTKKQDPYRRWGEHISELSCNKHYNKPLQNSWNKYGKEKFEFSIMEEFIFPENYSSDYIHEYILDRELYHINTLSPHYNICRETRGGKIGRILSKEEKEKKKTERIGFKHSPESIQKIKEARARQVITEEHKKNISKKLKGRIGIKGRKLSKEHIEAIIKARKNIATERGYYHSEETKKKISESQKGKIITDECKQKMAKSRENRILTKEHKSNLSKAGRKRHTKEFDVFDKNMNYITTCSTLVEAGEKLGLSKRNTYNIRKVLVGKYKHVNNYIFKYKEVSIG